MKLFLLLLLALPHLSFSAVGDIDKSSCSYNLNEMAIYKCAESSCKTQICIGSVSCKTAQGVLIKLDVACPVTNTGYCPAYAEECMDNNSVTFEIPASISGASSGPTKKSSGGTEASGL